MPQSPLEGEIWGSEPLFAAMSPIAKLFWPLLVVVVVAAAVVVVVLVLVVSLSSSPSSFFFFFFLKSGKCSKHQQ